jgi:hypothetical protein
MNADSDLINREHMPWHKFGERLHHTFTAEQAMLNAGLDWKVAKKGEIEGKASKLSVLVREDLWDLDGRGMLGLTRAAFTPIQNVDAFTLFDPMVLDGAMVYDSAGVWGLGACVWMILRLPGEIEVAPNDFVGQFLLFGHYPTIGDCRLTYLPVRLATHSLLTEEAYHYTKPLVTDRNVSPRGFEESNEIALEQIQDHFMALCNTFKAMAEIKLNPIQAKEYFDSVFDKFANREKGIHKKIFPPEEIQEGCRVSADLFQNSPGNDLPGDQRTLWAAYCALTEYHDYHKAVPSDWKYLREIWFSPLKACALQVATAITEGRAPIEK